MKTHIITLIACLALVSCQNPADTARALAIGDRLLAYGERHGVINPDEAALVRDLGAIAVSPPQAVPPEATTVSGK